MSSCKDCVLPQLLNYLEDEYVHYIMDDLSRRGIDEKVSEEIVTVILNLHKLKLLDMLK